MKPNTVLTPSWSTLISSLPTIPHPPVSPESSQHVKPFVHESLSTKALHFSIGEMQSRMRIQDPHALDLEYTRTMMGFLMFKPKPLSIAMIGLGGGSLAKFCHRYLPRSRIQVVEINPHVIALRDVFHVPPNDARFSVVQGDGAQFVRHHATGCDVLLVDGFDSDGQPARLSSQRFYDDCHRMLRPKGIMVVNLHYGHERFGTFLGRIRNSFDGRVLLIDGMDLSNTIVFACKGQAFSQHRAGIVRRPNGLASAAEKQLLAGFALIASALKDQQG